MRMSLFGRLPIKQQLQQAFDKRIDKRAVQLVESKIRDVTAKGLSLDAALRLALTQGISAVIEKDGGVGPYAYNPWVYRCINFISDSLASAPLLWYRGDEPNENCEEAKLFANPNPYMSGYQLIETSFTFLELYDRGCVWYLTWGKNRLPGQSRLPREIWVHPPNRWTPKVDKDGDIVAWEYRDRKGKKTIPPDEVIQFRYITPYHGHFRSQPSIRAALKTIQTEKAAKEYEMAMYKNGCWAGGTITFPPEVSPEEVKGHIELIEDRHKGETKAHRLMGLGGGAAYTDATKSLKDMLAKDLHELNAKETVLVFGLNLTALGVDMGGQSIFGPNIKEARRLAWNDALIPKQRTMEDKLLIDFCKRFKSPLVPRFDNSQVSALRENKDEKWKRAMIAIARGMSWRKANETFDLQIPNPESLPDIGHIPMNLVPIDGGGSASDGSALRPKQHEEKIAGDTACNRIISLVQALPSDVPSKSAKDHWAKQREDFMKGLKPLQAKYADKVHTWLYEYRSQLLANFARIAPETFGKAVKKQTIDPQTQAAFEMIIPNLEEELIKLAGMSKAHIQEALQYGGDYTFAKLMAMGLEVGKFDISTEATLKLLFDRTMKTSELIIGNLHDRLYGIMEESYLEGKSVPDTIKDIKNHMGIADGRVKTTAHEQMVGTAEQGKYEAMKAEGIKKKQWIYGHVAKDPRPSHQQADGEIVNMFPEDELFSTGLLHPHDWANGSEEDNLNCNCDMVMPEVAPDGHEYTMDELI